MVSVELWSEVLGTLARSDTVVSLDIVTIGLVSAAAFSATSEVLVTLETSDDVLELATSMTEPGEDCDESIE